MNLKIYKPKVDKLFWILFIPTNAFCIPLTLIPAIKEPQTIFITVPILLFVNYFFASSLCGYVALCDEDLFIKYGFFLKKRIPYVNIRALEKGRRFYSYSMLSIKNAYEHVDIKYNFYDVTTVSVKNMDLFIAELEERSRTAKSKL